MTHRWMWWGSAFGIALLAAAGAWLLIPDPPATLAVVDRLYTRDPLDIVIDEAVTPDASQFVTLAARAARRWTAAGIGTWTEVMGPSGSMLRSPALDLDATDEIEALVIDVAPAPHAGGLQVLWSEADTPTPSDYGRSRREVQPQPDAAATVVVRGSALHGDRSGMPRYLFLGPADRAAAFSSIAMVTAADRVANSPAARMRITASGGTRDAYFLRTPGRLIWEIAPQREAELRLGVSMPDAAADTRLRIEVSSGGRAVSLYNGPARSAGPASLAHGLTGWYDLRLPLTLTERGTLRVSIDGDSPGVAYVSEPTILAPAESAYPNVVVFVVDSLRADALAAYGAAQAAPFLDRLALQSLVFDRAYAAAAWTKPAVASLLTGLYPSTHRVGGRYYGDRLPERVRTLQGELRANGYVTAQFSGTPFTGALSNVDRGFDQAFGPSAFAEAGRKVKAEELNVALLPWIDAHRDDRFFVYAHVVDTQRPYPLCDRPMRDSEAYAEAVRRVDEEIARVHTRLAELDLADRTLFIVTGDHGDAFGEHGSQGHGQSVYDEEVRVPLMVHWPNGITAGRSSVLVTHVDLMPTVLDYVGVSVPTGLDGRSVAGRGEPARPSPIFLTRFTYPDDATVRLDRTNVDAVIDYPWKLIARGATIDAARLELFDLAVDPAERTNLAPREPERAMRLAARLRQFLQERASARARFLAAYPD